MGRECEIENSNKIWYFCFFIKGTILPKKEGQEGELLSPVSPYALTKRVDEEYGKLYTRLYGLGTYGLLYFNVFGRKQDRMELTQLSYLNSSNSSLMTSDLPSMETGNNRDFTYIENVIEANLKACLAPLEFADQSFNIAYGGREYLIDICMNCERHWVKILNRYLRGYQA
jgi:UDP-N-acetylglucosamine 4-epimerase